MFPAFSFAFLFDIPPSRHPSLPLSGSESLSILMLRAPLIQISWRVFLILSLPQSRVGVCFSWFCVIGGEGTIDGRIRADSERETRREEVGRERETVWHCKCNITHISVSCGLLESSWPNKRKGEKLVCKYKRLEYRPHLQTSKQAQMCTTVIIAFT